MAFMVFKTARVVLCTQSLIEGAPRNGCFGRLKYVSMPNSCVVHGSMSVRAAVMPCAANIQQFFTVCADRECRGLKGGNEGCHVQADAHAAAAQVWLAQSHHCRTITHHVCSSIDLARKLPCE